MNSQLLKSHIKLYLSRFETLVRISSLNNEYDIHNHSENFLIPFLKKIYGWDLINANIVDKNAESIDLIEPKKKIAIQVSSNSKLEKVKNTLQKFLNSKYKNEIEEIYFYFLLPKQKTYSIQVISKIIKGKLAFDTKTHILDNETIYGIIKQITNIKKLKEIEDFLKSEFSDFKVSKDVPIEEFETFKSKYKASCLSNYTRLNFFGLSIPNKPREVQLYSLFVKPNFSQGFGRFLISKRWIKNFSDHKILKANNFNEVKNIYIDEPELFLKESIEHIVPIKRAMYYGGSEKVLFHDLFKYGSHLVLLGDPGAGKSSLVKYSICKIIEEDYKIFKDRDIYSYLPYRVELHKYNQFKKEHSGGFLDFIKLNLINEFQIDTKPIVLDQIIEHFPCIIFFDGLDEIFDIQERLQVRNDIENFIKQNKLVRSIVTSRYESYEEVKLNTQLYNVLNVTDFDDDQISEYVERWYKIEEENDKLRNQEIKDCILQLKNVDNQLKHNPLLLSLILILYRNEQDLPTSKLEIYEGCCQTLVETRDKKEKKLALELKVPHKISVFSNLAFWQFKNESKNKDITVDYKSITNFITTYLINKGEFQDRNEAEDASKQFLEYAKLRSIYFENKFTHKTFYEYFTSHYIFSNYYSTPGQYENFLDLLHDNIGLSAWAVILELLICQVDGSQLEYKVMDSIIDHLLNKKPYETCNLFATVMPYLRTLSPIKARTLVYSMISYVCSKQNNLTNRNILKEKLLELIKIKRFEEIFYTEVGLELKKQTTISGEIFDFLFELSIVLKVKRLELIIESYKEYKNYDKKKYFIISNLKEIKEGSKTLQLFKDFLNSFGKKSSLNTYSSNYDFICFGGTVSFNWIFTLLLQAKNKNDLNVLENKLEELKITRKDIIKTLNQNTDSMREQLYLIVATHKTFAKDMKIFSKDKIQSLILTS